VIADKLERGVYRQNKTQIAPETLEISAEAASE